MRKRTGEIVQSIGSVSKPPGSSLKTHLPLAGWTASSMGKERWQTMGLIGAVVVVLVAHTCHNEEDEPVIRIISARKATAHERRQYERYGQ